MTQRWSPLKTSADGGRPPLSAGLNNNTWNNRLSMIPQVFEFALTDRMLPSNPACQSLRLKPKKNEAPLPYSDEQAARILTASRLEARPSRRWAHWIMAFTGMRVGEVLQLFASDPEYSDPFCVGH